MYKTYQVRSGENIMSIAEKLGITPDEIRRINGFTPNYEVSLGELIVVPSMNKSPFDVYSVVKGDTLYAIAQRYNISDNQLALLNGLDKDEYIFPNQELLVPKKGVSFHVVTENETIEDVSKRLNAPINDLISQNERIILQPDQLIVYQRS